MGAINHWQQAVNPKDALLAFVGKLRENRFNVGIQESLEALEAMDTLLLLDADRLKYALSSLFCCNYEESQQFEEYYNEFWLGKAPEKYPEGKKIPQARVTKSYPGSLVMLGKSSQPLQKAEEDARPVSGASNNEKLRQTDFSKLNAIETEMLEEIARRLFKQMHLRLKRKRKQEKKGLVDLRKSIRGSMEQGGELLNLVYKNRQKRKLRLTILLDISGSMDKYSLFLLRFIHVLQESFSQIEAFVFSTGIQRITDHIKGEEIAAVLNKMSKNVLNWSSGTRIGECFRIFNEQFARHTVNKNTLLIILSDGLDTGKPEMLANQILKMKRRARRIIWLNPLKGMKNYAPLARGMAAALPAIDVFQSAHNLDSILELEQYLTHV